MTRRRQHRAQVVGSFMKIPKPLEEGKARCAGCSKVVAITPTGRLRRHRSPRGDDCAFQAVVR